MLHSQANRQSTHKTFVTCAYPGVYSSCKAYANIFFQQIVVANSSSDRVTLFFLFSQRNPEPLMRISHQPMTTSHCLNSSEGPVLLANVNVSYMVSDHNSHREHVDPTPTTWLPAKTPVQNTNYSVCLKVPCLNFKWLVMHFLRQRITVAIW